MIYSVLKHLENKDSYIQMLLIDYSSAFNTVTPSKLINKLSILGVTPVICN